MFTGLITDAGKILEINSSPEGKRCLISCAYTDIQQGESIAINGICLTALDCTLHQFYADISPETLAVTTAQFLKPGDTVNLERALRLQDRLGGHFVLGHVDQIGRVLSKKFLDTYTEYVLGDLLPDTKKFLIHKGSIAINGVSLTINRLTADTLSVMLIPETLRNTNLAALAVGDSVNLEYDYLAKITAKQLNQ
jgi:riboflavin synthase